LLKNGKVRKKIEKYKIEKNMAFHTQQIRRKGECAHFWMEYYIHTNER
jgi:hypothetical protein